MAWLKRNAQENASSAAAAQAAGEGSACGGEMQVPAASAEVAAKRNRRKRETDVAASILTWVVWALIFVYSLSLLALYGWVVMSSLKNTYAWMVDSFGFPVEVTLENYVTAFESLKVTVFTDAGQKEVYLEMLLLNSFAYLVGCGFVATVAPCVMAYAASKFNFAFNKVIDGIVIVTMILPIIGALPSEIEMARMLGLYGNFPGMYFMKFMFLGANYLYFKSAFKGVPDDFSEAAKVDGASQFRVMFQINLPMVSNIFFIIFLLQMIGFWGDWQTPMIYLPYNPTVAYALYDVQFSTTLPLSFKPVQLAACVLGSIPTLIAFIFFKNKIMGGLAFGGLKG